MGTNELKPIITVSILRALSFENIISLVMLFILLTAAAAGTSQVLTGPDWSSLWESLLFGLLIGWVLGFRRYTVWQFVLIATTIGLFFTLLFPSGLDRKIYTLIAELFRLSRRIFTSFANEVVDFSSLSSLAIQVIDSALVVLARVMNWVKASLTGQPNFDPVAAGFVWNLMLWMVSAWAGWMVQAGRNALLAVLPALLLNIGTLSYGQTNSITVYIILGTTLVLIALVQHKQQKGDWDETKIAYPEHTCRQIVQAALIIAIILVFLSAFISSLSFKRIIQWAAEVRQPSDQGENRLAKSLGILPAATAKADTFSTVRQPGLPRDLLIGSGPELSGVLVMSVEVKNLFPLTQQGQPLPLYWRSFTYDVYTGYGWQSNSTELQWYQPDQPFQTSTVSQKLLLQQVVRPVPGTAGTIYAAGEPLVVNIPTSVARRSSGDLFGIQTTSREAYQVSSHVPQVDERRLRTAGERYPDWIVKRYLALPMEVPARVKELAIQLTATEPTAYDRALSIESYLRTYPYSLDVPRPAQNHDLVDFFLFDLKEGYCDYYASAMVVLARAGGIPARLAIGYASGIYNLNSKRFMVSQADAHSWVEIYFPEIGWVPFEPTAALPLLDRSQLAGSQEPTIPPALGETQRSYRSKPGRLVVIAGLVFIALLSIIWTLYDEIHLLRLIPKLAAGEVYHRMRRYGRLLRVAIEPGETAYEFADSLCARVLEISKHTTTLAWGKKLVGEAQSIIRRIVCISYRPSEMEAERELSILQQWKSLRWRLRWLLILEIIDDLKQQLWGRSLSFTGKVVHRWTGG